MRNPAISRRSDPARFEVVKNALSSAAEEMRIVLAKTAFSPLLKVAGDYSCGIFDFLGNMVAQGPDLPMHLGSMPDAVRAVVAAFPNVMEGDVFIHNDPYDGGSHLPDVNIVAPAFHAGRLLGYGCVRAHWPDVGGANPGSYAATREVYGEGLRLPPVQLFRRGQPEKAVEAIILANVRNPEERLGDIRAQVAAAHRAGLRLSLLADKYGADELIEIMQEILDYSELMMRKAIALLPDGVARVEDTIDGDGILEPGESEDASFRLEMKITKRDDTIDVDFTGSDERVAGPMNAPLTVTASGVYCALKMVVDPTDDIPPNSGCWRPITITARPGSVVNAVAPASVVYANHEMSHRIADMVMAAMYQLVPEKVMAGSQGTSGIVTFGGLDPRSNERYVDYESVKGGFGARASIDGINAIASTVSNMMNTPVEVVEMNYPLRIEEYSLRVDSGGAGTYRGGLGVRRSWRVLGHTSHASCCFERTRTAPFGLAGGEPGACASLSVISASHDTRALPGKGAFVVASGELVVVDAPGSGGYGCPTRRDPAKLASDMADGYVTERAAGRDYGWAGR